jgi:hypothetical protein
MRFELRDTHHRRDNQTPDINTPNEPPTSVIYLKVSCVRHIDMFIQS